MKKYVKLAQYCCFFLFIGDVSGMRGTHIEVKTQAEVVRDCLVRCQEMLRCYRIPPRRAYVTMKKCDGTELDHAIAREHFPSWLMALNAYFEKVTEPGTSHADSLYLKDSFQRMNYRNPCLLDVAGLLSACRDERLFNRLITMWHRGYDEPFLVCELINSILDHVRGGTYAVRVGSAGTYGTSLGIEICGLPCLYMGREACAKGLSSLFVVFNYRGDSLELGSIYQLSPGRSRLFESYCRILDLSSSLHHFHIVDPIGLGSVVMRFSTKA